MRLAATIALLVMLVGSAGATDNGALGHYAGEGKLVTVPAGIGASIGLVLGVPLGVVSAALCAPVYYPAHAVAPTWTRHTIGDGAGECAWLGLLVSLGIADAGYVAFGAPFHAIATPPARDQPPAGGSPSPGA